MYLFMQILFFLMIIYSQMYLFPELFIYLFLLFSVQHKNKGGGPCGAPVNHWLRVHADQMRGIKESVLYFYYDFIYISC